MRRGRGSRRRGRALNERRKGRVSIGNIDSFPGLVDGEAAGASNKVPKTESTNCKTSSSLACHRRKWSPLSRRDEPPNPSKRSRHGASTIPLLQILRSQAPNKFRQMPFVDKSQAVQAQACKNRSSDRVVLPPRSRVTPKHEPQALLVPRKAQFFPVQEFQSREQVRAAKPYMTTEQPTRPAAAPRFPRPERIPIRRRHPRPLCPRPSQTAPQRKRNLEAPKAHQNAISYAPRQ